MEKEIYIKKGWLFIPVCATYGELPFGGKKNNRMLEIFCREDNSETKLFEFQIPAGEAEDDPGSRTSLCFPGIGHCTV